MKSGFGPVFWILVVASLAVGCGKRDLNLSVKAADSERDQPTAALVRKVELTYSSPAGKEQMHQSIPVLGLSQPVSARADLLKDVEVEEGGVFEARGYTSEGLLMLRGLAQAHDNSEGVEIAMGRDGNPPELMDKPLLRRVRLANVPNGSSFEKDVKDLPATPNGGSEHCTELPALKIGGGQAGSFPKIILEAAVKAPKFTVELGVRLEKGLFKALEGERVLPINPAGDAELELGRQLLNGALLKHAWKLMFRLHSSRYEGCFEVTTNPEFFPPELSEHLTGGWGKAPNFFNNEPMAYMDVFNPNTVPMRIEIAGAINQAQSGAVMWPCYDLSAAPRPLSSVRCKNQMAAKVLVSAGGFQRIGVFGALPQSGSSYFDMVTKGLKVSWVINAEAVAEDGSVLDSRLPTQNHLMEVP